MGVIFIKLLNMSITAGWLILAVLGIVSCALIFKGLREKPENRTNKPFGPAMVVAAFIALIL